MAGVSNASSIHSTERRVWWTVIRPPVRSNGRTYKMLVMFILFFRHAFSEFPRPIALKLCHMVGMLPNFIMQVQKLGGGALPPKNPGAKKHAKFRRFWTTSDFDREYLRNGWRYPKSADVTNYGNSSCVWWKKVRWTLPTNGLEFHVSLDPLKCTFLADYISAHREFYALKILHALEIDQALIAHTRSGTGVPQKNFNRENLKFGLKFSVLATITSGLVGISPQNIFHTTCHGTGVITWV